MKHINEMKLTTLCFLVKDDKVLLAMKKRGFGAGKWNGVGGKVETGESVLEAMVREAEEEIGVKIDCQPPPRKAGRGLLHFFFENKPDCSQECHVFVADKWQGEPTETEEMKPKWFPINSLPFEKMWIDDLLWLPKVLEGQSLEAEFFFNSDGSALLSHSIKLLKAS